MSTGGHPSQHMSVGAGPHLDTQKPKRTRASKSKVKTGCAECKRRRIKCDEARPYCKNCVRSKKSCPGYPAPKRSAQPLRQLKMAPRPPVIAASTTLPSKELIQVQVTSRPKYSRCDTPPMTPPPAEGPAVPMLTDAAPWFLSTQDLGLSLTEGWDLSLTDAVPWPCALPAQGTALDLPTETTVCDLLAEGLNWNVCSNASVTLYTPSVDLPFGDQQGQYFRLFRDRTACELSGYFDSVFWSQTVLQECHRESVIRHAVVAIGALYKTLETSSQSPFASKNHWNVAVSHYQNALDSMAYGLKLSDRTKLMSHVLLACFDSFTGAHQQAIGQIKTGVHLLNTLRRERQRSCFVQQEPIEEELVQIFKRLAIQAKSYDMAFHFPQPFNLIDKSDMSHPTSPTSEPAPSPMSVYLNRPWYPERFSTLREARLSWDQLTERLFRYTETMFDQEKRRGTMILPETLQPSGVTFENEITAWSRAFSPILSNRAAPCWTSQVKAGIAVLKMMQINTEVLFSMTYNASEMSFDMFDPQFRHIVDLAQEVVGDEERRAMAQSCPDPAFCQHYGNTHDSDDVFDGVGDAYTARHIKPSFSADLGIVPPLFVVATKCRNHEIRRQAIQLLRSSARREAMWDSELTARIAMWISKVEDGEEDVCNTMLTPSTSGDNLAMGTPDTLHGGTRSWSLSSGTASSTSMSRNTSIDLGEDALATMRRSVSRVVPEEKRVMIRSVDFDLREHRALVKLGTRGVEANAPDLRTRAKEITW